MDSPLKLAARGKGKMDANSKEAKQFKEWLLKNHAAVEAQYGLPKGSLLALSGHESRFDPLAQSWSGATGAFQLIRDTARGFGLRVDSEVDERLIPEKAIHAAAKYMQENLKRYKGNITHAIAQWNGGNAAPKFLAQGNSAKDYKSPNGTVGELDKFLTGVKNVALEFGFTDIADDIDLNAYQKKKVAEDPLQKALAVDYQVPEKQSPVRAPNPQNQSSIKINSSGFKAFGNSGQQPESILEEPTPIIKKDNTTIKPVIAQKSYMPVFESKDLTKPMAFTSQIKEPEKPVPISREAGLNKLLSMAPSLFRIFKEGGSIVQLSGDGKTVEAMIKGKERIYSRPDTKRLVELAKSAKSENDLFLLGKFFYDATKKQDSREPEYVDA